MKKYQNMPGLALENAFGSQCAVAGKWRRSALHFRKECNKYDITTLQCFLLPHHNDWSRWFAISSPPPIGCPSFNFQVGLQTSK
jgi:hypothetical protein